MDKQGRSARHPPSAAAAAIRTAATNKNANVGSNDGPLQLEDLVSRKSPDTHMSPSRSRLRSDYTEDNEDEAGPIPDVASRTYSKGSPKPSAVPVSEVRFAGTSPRMRSISAAPPPQTRPSISRKSSLGAVSPTPEDSDDQENTRPHYDASMPPPMPRTRAPNGNRPKALDLGSPTSDLRAEAFSARKPQFAPKAARPNRNTSRDLIDFLDQGPPENVGNFSSSLNSSQNSNLKQGRFRSMVTRLTGGTSTERLSSQYGTDGAGEGANTNGLRRIATVVPAQQPSSLNHKKSLGNIHTRGLVTMIGPLPPPVHHPQTPISPSSPVAETPTSSLSRPRYVSMNRKAVPTFEKPETHDLEVKEDAAKITSPVEYEPHIPPRGTSLKFSQLHSQKNSTETESPNGSIRGKVTDSSSSLTATSIPLIVKPKPSRTDAARLSQSASMATSQTMPSNLTTGPSTPSTELVDELRRKMAEATSASECRTLLDTVLVQAGYKTDVVKVEPFQKPIAPAPTYQDTAKMAEFLLGASDDVFDAAPIHAVEVSADSPASTGFISTSSTLVSTFSTEEMPSKDVASISSSLTDTTIISVGA